MAGADPGTGVDVGIGGGRLFPGKRRCRVHCRIVAAHYRTAPAGAGAPQSENRIDENRRLELSGVEQHQNRISDHAVQLAAVNRRAAQRRISGGRA